MLTDHEATRVPGHHLSMEGNPVTVIVRLPSKARKRGLARQVGEHALLYLIKLDQENEGPRRQGELFQTDVPP